ncbi:Piso0_001674 [Millerozyma farinosa CBS 7064]|uniref:Piso0_001674 protein n=1 Tax=Pichia sorbitophila (strain ATCC MYA-4447 / BCRC 22081 / CBS 7064 / NBRC 10061 / NRRL Y-12695) TaxID=559304 RepID=G8YNS9_PICSO|nr:Piso0_001674 [Millerozyma farinosa CBS 7064]
MKNIEYIITAEFHIDRGPSLIDSFPGSIPGLKNLPFLPETMIPDQIHKREDDYTLFLLFRDAKTGEFCYMKEDKEYEEELYFLYTIVFNSKDDVYRRGSQIKSLSLITRLSFFKSFRPLMTISLEKYFHNNDVTCLQELYQSLNSKNFDTGYDISMSKKLLVTSVLDLFINEKIYGDQKFRKRLLEIKGDENKDLFIRKDLSFNSVVQFCGMSLPVKVPMISLPDTVGDYLNPTDLNLKGNLIDLLEASLATKLYHEELTIYGLQTPPIIILINAILTGKKIIILSYENSAGHIIDTVFLILKIITGGGILCNILSNYNVFPIIDVSKIDYLERCDHYIAGTINPFFKHNEKLWDLMYDLDSNEIFLSKEYCYTENEAQGHIFKNSIISEDAKFLSNLQLSLFTYNDDLSTIQLIFRRHINEIIRIMLSSKNFIDNRNVAKSNVNLLLSGVGYYWNSDTNKLLEMTCYQTIGNKFQNLLYDGVFSYSLLLSNLANELNTVIDLQHHMQSLTSMSNIEEEKKVWRGILQYLVSGRSLENLLLVTYLIPPSSSLSLQSSSSHGGGLTIFDKNKGIEIILINLFHYDDEIKSIVVTILKELQENFLGEWCLSEYLRSNVMYELAFDDLSSDVS